MSDGSAAGPFFGEVPGNAEGAVFENRAALARHRIERFGMQDSTHDNEQSTDLGKF